MRWAIRFLALGAFAAGPVAAAERVIAADDFGHGLDQWVVEQQPGGSVTVSEGRLIIADRDGCTVWFRQRLTAPVVITYEAKMSSAHRVSDLNCFWMATDPARPDDLFAAGHARDGRFTSYDGLRTYYVGYGGNANSTTRFRRYDGTGARPLQPQHDLGARKFLLVPDHVYHLKLVVTAGGRVQYLRDGEIVFDFQDPAPLTSGWFGFRTVQSKMELSHFRVVRPE
jgi:hypothetical protein